MVLMKDKKVVFIPCQTYQEKDIDFALDRVFEELGGLDGFVKPGHKVLLKVNLLMKKPPEAAVTTHPALVEALVNRIHALGAEVIIGDSPGGPFNKSWIKGIYHESGMEEVAQKTGAKLNWNFEQEEFPNPDGLILKNITLARMVKEADVIISLAKLKTHGFTIYTGAVKNLFGTIPGLLKAEYHVRMSELKDFCNMLVDIAEFVKPQLTIMDAITAMEGAGPSAGTPKHVGLLAASTNPHALDLACCHLIGLEPKRVLTLQNAVERGLIPDNIEGIEITGIDKKDFKPIPFKIPVSSHGRHIPIPLPAGLDAFLYKILRPFPFFIHSKCVGCGICARDCPAKCIKMIDGKPHADLSSCIRCFCCQELCSYQAVEIRRGKLSKLLFR